jgi:hypothetical protein
MAPRIFDLITALLAVISIANGHGSHESTQNPAAVNDWATRHMQGKYLSQFTVFLIFLLSSYVSTEEHHIDNFDAGSFFALHDFDASGAWTPDEIRKTYGLEDPSNAHVTEEQKQEVVREVLALFDPLKTGRVSRSDWVRLSTAGKRLPDLGFGPGHHGDMEYEYEIHHFEKYHGEDAKEEDLTHPEDIEHFRKHDEVEEAQERLEQLERMQVVEANIPQKFLRRS